MQVAILVIAISSFIILSIIILQIMYIRFRLEDYKKDNYKRTLSAQDAAYSMLQEDSKIRIYGLVIDMELTEFIATNGGLQRHLDVVVDAFAPSLPYVCDTGLKSVSTRFEKVVVLVTQTTRGSELLTMDLGSQAVNYVVMNHSVYLVRPLENIIPNTITPYLADNKMNQTLEKFQNKTIFAFYPVGNNASTDVSMPKDCTFSMQPFLGNIAQFGGSSKYVNTSTIFSSSSATSAYPVQIIAYKAA
jgi:hypothetical protein